MNKELQITIIACAIVFAGISVLAVETMNSGKVIVPQSQTSVDKIAIPDKIIDKPAKSMQEPLESSSMPVDENTTVKTITFLMNISDTNRLPWGTIEGTVKDPAEGHPVIIQFFKSIEGDPIHVAQVDLKGDNTYEYKFRVLSIDEGVVTHYFVGDYYVKIFETVNNQ